MKAIKRFFKWLFRINPKIGVWYQLNNCGLDIENLLVKVIYAADGVVTVERFSPYCGLMFQIIPLSRFNAAYDEVFLKVNGTKVKISPIDFECVGE